MCPHRLPFLGRGALALGGLGPSETSSPPGALSSPPGTSVWLCRAPLLPGHFHFCRASLSSRSSHCGTWVRRSSLVTSVLVALVTFLVAPSQVLGIASPLLPEVKASGRVMEPLYPRRVIYGREGEWTVNSRFSGRQAQPRPGRSRCVMEAADLFSFSFFLYRD